MAYVCALPKDQLNLLQRKLFIGIHSGSASYVKDILEQKQFDVNDDFPKDVLQFTLEQKEYELVKHLTNTPLSVAASYRRYKICDLLLKAGADVNLKSRRGYLSLKVFIRCMQLYIGYCALRQETTLLHLASFEHNARLLEYLLKNGGDVDATDEDENTPLHYAVTKYNGEKALNAVKCLVEHGALVNARNIYGYTPIFVNQEVEQIRKGIHKDIKRSKENTAHKMVAYFHKHGSNFDIKTYDGHTILHHCLMAKEDVFFAALEPYCGVTQSVGGCQDANCGDRDSTEAK